MLLVASYFFYGFWDWRFLSLIIFSTLLDFFCGQAIHNSPDQQRRKLLLGLSVAGNLGILGFFKYFNFFAENLAALLARLGLDTPEFLLSVVLPVGISFYTFQTMSYSLDIYRGQLKPTKNLLDFALFVAFFPQLVSGPIERARNLLPQITAERRFNRQRFYEGSWLISWGLYKKVFVADNIAKIVDKVYGSPSDFSGFHILVATYAFAVQIYGDFSGYSDIARGLAKTMGFEISLNFDVPYAARNPREFWRRWHITLSQWLRDYLYIPLGGSRGSRGRVFTNLMVTMGLGGLWHGAQWHFVIWGLYHGLLLAGYRLIRGDRPGDDHRAKNLAAMFVMFHFTCLGWMLFRVRSMAEMQVIAGKLVSRWQFGEVAASDLVLSAFYSSLIMIVQVFQYRSRNTLVIFQWPPAVRVALYVAIYLSLSLGGTYDGPQFIYFQF